MKEIDYELLGKRREKVLRLRRETKKNSTLVSGMY